MYSRSQHKIQLYPNHNLFQNGPSKQDNYAAVYSHEPDDIDRLFQHMFPAAPRDDGAKNSMVSAQ